MLSLMHQEVQVLVYSRSKDDQMVAALSERDESFQCVVAVEAERDDAFRRVEVVEASSSTKSTELQAVQWATEELKAKHEVVLRQMGNTFRKVSCLQSDISRVRERLAVSAYFFTRGCDAVVGRMRVVVDRMR